MSFKLGTFDTNSVEGFKAILVAWPTLPVDLQLEELPAGDGSLFYRARMTETEWEFRLELTGDNVADVMDKADLISRALNPKLGKTQSFTPNAADGWVWQGVLGAAIEWERDKVLWFSDQGVSRLGGSATIVTPNPYGYAVGSSVVLSSDGTLSLLGAGNTSWYPTIEFRGVLSSTQSVLIGGTRVTGPLTSSQTMVLDFENLDFYIKTTSTGAKVRAIADRFTTFQRIEGVGRIDVPVSVSGGTFTQARGIIKSRRI